MSLPILNQKIDYFAEPIIFIAGPTASGKTELAIQIANEFGCEIIGVDSMQVYKYMDIGSAKPSKSELAQVPHHLIGYVDPAEPYNASRFVVDCRQVILDIRKRNKFPLLVGGTGLYFQALEFGMFTQPEIDETIREELAREAADKGNLELHAELSRVDPESARRIHPNDSYRISRALEIFRSTGKSWSEYIEEHRHEQAKCYKKLLKIGLNHDREQLYQRINRRVIVMIKLGLVDEVKKLLSMGYPATLSAMQSLGYRHITAFLAGEWDWEKTLELLARDTRRYAKRQFTWFRKDKEIHWYYPEEKDQLLAKISKFLAA
jgi:tRNA dimethylallyltransferase